MLVLFCGDPLTPGRVDPYFAGQAGAVRGLGGTTALIDHDELLAGNATAAVRRVPHDCGPAWYRGWMIPSDRYAELAGALSARGVPLRVTAERYRSAHELPGWYATFASLTPHSVWTAWPPLAVPTTAQVGDLVKPLGNGPGIVKDFVKSRKHEWAEACFVPDLADTERAAAVIQKMVELQDDTLQGGIVVRRFEVFERPEARVWWIDGEAALVTAHPDSPGEVLQPDLAAVAPPVRRWDCRFVTTDVALREDGVWRVVEVGDGQVSDLPAGLDPKELYRRLSSAHA